MKLALFFTFGVALQGWRKSGTLERDMALYHALSQHGWEITFVTYGSEDDHKVLPPGSPIRLLTRPHGMNPNSYGRRIPFLHREALQDVDIIKSHQINGSRYAAWSALVLNKPFVARCGFLASLFEKVDHRPWPKRLGTLLEELFVFQRAKAIALPEEGSFDYVSSRYHVPRQRLHACPNWIDTQQFKPNPTVTRSARRLVFVGRFEEQKNPMLLLDAVRTIPEVELLMVGGGSLKPRMEAFIAQHRLNAQLIDRVDNAQMPDLLNSSSLFVLPTRFEGSPKAILEAMACGLPVVITNAPGVDHVFRHKEHGLKCPVDDLSSLRQAIRTLLDDPVRGISMGLRGREEVLARFSLEKALAREIALLAPLLPAKNQI